jgi:RHS repeat-associated protein
MKVIKKPFLWILTCLMIGMNTAYSGEVVYFYHTDPSGTPLAMTDVSGNVVWRADYLPFGEENIINGVIENDQKFVGKQQDKETGLYYFGARYMESMIGRFISPDPASITTKDLLNPQRFNRYSYGFNNPYRYLDPDGRFSTEVHRRFTMQVLQGNGFSPRAVEKVSEGNVSIDIYNPWDNYQHSMRDVGESRDTAITASEDFKREQLREAGRLIASGEYERGLYELGKGLHTVQDRKHNWITLPEHGNPAEIYTDFKPTRKQEKRALSDT